MLNVNLNPDERQIRLFGVLMLLFGALLGSLVWYKGGALLGAAVFLAAAWLISLALNRESRKLQLLGIILPALCFAVGWPIKQGVDALAVATVVWIIGGLVGVFTMLWIDLGRRLYVGWTLAAVPIGWTVSHVVVSIVFYLVMAPIGLIMRMVGHDPMCRHLDPNASSYWMAYNPKADSARYFRQF